MTVISASYKTDIPAFYADWFRARRAAGACEVRNVWNGKTFRVSLRDEDCSGFVFWTRNARPFRGEIERTARTHPFFVQYTVTGYPRALERSVLPGDAAVDDMRLLSARYGSRAVVWRYDPILISDATPAPWHPGNFSRLAAALDGAADEVVVSFAQIYRKTRRNLDRARRKSGNAWRDPGEREKRDLLAELRARAARHGLKLTLCAQPELGGGEIPAARCIDAERLSAMAAELGHSPVRAPTKGARPGCLCADARDIGAYETCPHGCVYCYAVSDPQAARRARTAHDPAMPGLFAPAAYGRAGA